jgi:hypothetical protein
VSQRGAVFTISVRLDDESPDTATRFATCDKCGQELTAAMHDPVSVISIPNLERMVAREPARVVAIRKLVDTAFERARSTRMPIVIDSAYEVRQLNSAGLMQEILREHAVKCSVPVAG